MLQGIFSARGSPASVTGPWTQDRQRVQARRPPARRWPPTFGYSPAVQTWYNQDLAVDPANPDHVYAGLEEVFESTDGGNTWITASPYWNYLRVRCHREGARTSRTPTSTR